MNPQKTYQLMVAFSSQDAAIARRKEEVKNWLMAQGIQSFVEGSLDDLDIDHEFVAGERDFYSELGGDLSPLSIFSYHQEYLLDLQAKLMNAFGSYLSCQLSSMETSSWMEGWKESFKPISTARFYIYPPWDKPESCGGRIPLEIDPGMAFGTGQHATTQVCLRQLESLFGDPSQWAGKRLLDVGTGSGILAIAAKKLGCPEVEACDIDIDAVGAAKENARVNQVSFQVWQGSLPRPHRQALVPTGGYDVVVANILFVVLAKLVAALAAELKPTGRLILSGVLEEQKEEMVAAAQEVGLQLLQVSTQDGWACILMEKTP